MHHRRTHARPALVGDHRPFEQLAAEAGAAAGSRRISFVTGVWSSSRAPLASGLPSVSDRGTVSGMVEASPKDMTWVAGGSFQMGSEEF